MSTGKERTGATRTRVQREANRIDCELYSAIRSAEDLYDSLKRYTGPRVIELHKSLQSLRSARVGIRMLMHADDRARTV